MAWIVAVLLLVQSKDALLESAKRKFEAQDFKGAIAEYDKVLQTDPRNVPALINRAGCKASLRDADGAAADYDRALQIEPRSAAIYAARSFSWMALGKYGPAIQDANKAIELNPKEALAFAARAMAKELSGNRNGVFEDINRAVELQPSSPRWIEMRGYLYHRHDRNDQALKDYSRAIDLNPKNPAPFARRGRLRHSMGDLKGAHEDLDRALEIEPANSDSWYRRAAIRHAAEDRDGALQDLARAIELNPKSASAWKLKAKIGTAGGDLAGAVEDYSKALELNPKDIDTLLTRTRLHMRLGSWTDALSDFRKQCELAPDRQRYPRLFIFLIREKLGEKDAAARELKALGDEYKLVSDFLTGAITEGEYLKQSDALGVYPERAPFAEAYSVLGAAKFLRGDRRAAMSDLLWAHFCHGSQTPGDIAALLDIPRPSTAEDWLSTAIARLGEGQFDKAIAAADKAADLHSSQSHLVRGWAHWGKRNPTQAIQDLDKAIELDPSNALAIRLRAHSKGMATDPEGAIADYDALLKLAPRDAWLWDEHGWGLGELGRWDEAIESHSKALQIDANYHLTQIHRAWAKIGKGDFEGAVEDCSPSVTKQVPYAFSTRAQARQRLMDFDEAFKDFDQAIKLFPEYAAAHLKRGCLKYDLGNLAGAQLDMMQAIRLDANEDYAHIRLWLLSAKRGARDRADEGLSGRIEKAEPWPSKIMAYLLGRMSEEQLIQASKHKTPYIGLGRKSEALFYIGSKREIEGKADAKDYYRRCVDLRIYSIDEYPSAVAALQKLVPPSLGLNVQEIPADARPFLPLKEGIGVSIAQVDPAGLAARYGIQKLDILVSINGEDVTWENVKSVVGALKPQEPIAIELLRKGRRMTVEIGKPARPVVILDTSMGAIEVELYPDKAPVTVNNFLAYVKKQFYDGLIFHRTIPNFMIQGGGLDADMNEIRNDPPIKNEADNGLKNTRGTIAMARLPEADSARSQFFINLVDNARLDHVDDRQFGYCVFGRVIRGMDIVDKIAQVKTTTRGAHADVPVEPVEIKTIRLKE